MSKIFLRSPRQSRLPKIIRPTACPSDHTKYNNGRLPAAVPLASLPDEKPSKTYDNNLEIAVK
jgi:hypothetical protein